MAFGGIGGAVSSVEVAFGGIGGAVSFAEMALARLAAPSPPWQRFGRDRRSLFLRGNGVGETGGAVSSVEMPSASRPGGSQGETPGTRAG
jgi:hypothetical protein